MASAEERFWAKVERREDHDVWTGSRDQRGVGMVRTDGKLRTVQRAAWEFTHGPLPPGVRVNSCATERACVCLGHLSLSPAPFQQRPPRVRRRRGSGSIREVRPGAWEVAITEGTTPSGRSRRRYLTIRGARADAERTLDRLVQETRRSDLGDLRVRELVARYLDWLADGANDTAVDRDRTVLHTVIDPELGAELATLVSPLDIETALRRILTNSRSPEKVREALRLLRHAYRWAIQRHWCTDDPTSGITTRDVTT